LSADLSRAYELLGVRPGVSSGELKAAHRDLAKVWHPDRFLHDPRLQEKAQEKLKEINEAYDLLSSGKIPKPRTPPRPTTPPPPVYSVQYAEEKVAVTRRKSNGPWVVLVFVAVFAVTITVLLQRRSLPLQQQEAVVEEPVNTEDDRSTRPDSNTRAEVKDASRNATSEESVPEVMPVETSTQPKAEVATVTVTIDPESGLLAKADCRLRSRMTYPNGSQPSRYCNLNHAPPPKDSKVKSFAKWLEDR
jgi:hypothetical protein